MVLLRLKIVGVDIQGKADLLNLNDTLVSSRFLFALGLFKAELAIVDDFAHRRVCLGSDLHQVQIFLLRNFQRLAQGHDAQLVAVRIDHAKLLIPDLLVDLQFLFANG